MVDPTTKTTNTSPTTNTTLSSATNFVDIPFTESLQPQANLADSAKTLHVLGDFVEQLPAEIALVRCSPTSAGVSLALKLKMSPVKHVGPTKFELPLIVCPENTSINDPKNTFRTIVVVDLEKMYQVADKNVENRQLSFDFPVEVA